MPNSLFHCLSGKSVSLPIGAESLQTMNLAAGVTEKSHLLSGWPEQHVNMARPYACAGLLLQQSRGVQVCCLLPSFFSQPEPLVHWARALLGLVMPGARRQSLSAILLLRVSP